MKKNIILLSALLSTVAFYSQVGINTDAPKATLDVTGKPSDITQTDGLIAPRLKGDELKSKDGNYSLPQTGAIVYVTEALATANTTVKTVNVTTSGYFYFDGSIWQKMTGNGAGGINNWNVENTLTPATLNTQNIYQNGNVGIGNFSASSPIAKLDVRGSMRGGTPHGDEVNGNSLPGANSLSYGIENKASGANSTVFGWRNNASGLRSQAIGSFNTASSESGMALGYQNEATGEMAVAIGQNSKASGYYSTALGQNAQSGNIFSTAIGLNAVASGLYALALSTHTATASGDQSVAIGAYTTATGNASTAMGRQTLAAGFVSTAIGERNAIRTGSLTSQPVGTDALFQVGNGSSVTPYTSFNNAMTILRNGHTAIGVNGVEDDAKPTELLDLGGYQYQGEGGLRIRNINSLDYRGDASDNIVVATPEGVLKTITPATVATEPFFVAGTITKATSNTQNIYQNGNLGLGSFATSLPIARLDVRGAVRGGTPHADELSGASSIGARSVSFGQNNKVSGLVAFGVGNANIASGQASIALGSLNESSGNVSISAGQGSKSAGYASVALGYQTTSNGYASVALGQATVASSTHSTALGLDSAIKISSGAFTDASLQLGEGPNNNLLTILKNGHTAIGVAGAEDDAKPTELLDLGGRSISGRGGLRVRNINSAAYAGSAADKIVVADATGVLKTITVSTISASELNFSTLATYPDDSSAGSGGLTTGKLYKTPTGELRIKL